MLYRLASGFAVSAVCFMLDFRKICSSHTSAFQYVFEFYLEIDGDEIPGGGVISSRCAEREMQVTGQRTVLLFLYHVSPSSSSNKHGFYGALLQTPVTVGSDKTLTVAMGLLFSSSIC